MFLFHLFKCHVYSSFNLCLAFSDIQPLNLQANGDLNFLTRFKHF